MAQPHKGPRKQIVSTRVHPDVFARVEKEAERLGVYKGDIVAHVLAKEFGLVEEHSPLRHLPQQHQMPMTA